MNSGENGPILSAGEWEVDFITIQLLETSTEFRQWLVDQITPQLRIDEYLGGVIHTSYAGEGESDIEFGFLTESGDRHLILIENKIDAIKQPDQIERYYNRGQFRVEQDEWDSFTVCLLAPERYVSVEDKTEFNSIIHYERVLDQLEVLSHDSSDFFEDVFELAMQRSITTTSDESDVLQSIADRFQNEIDLTNMHQTVSYKKRAGFRSTHPQHPDGVQYDVYIADPGVDGRTRVRLQIASEEGVTDTEREAIKSVTSQHLELLPDYDWKPHRKKNVLVKKIWHDDAIQGSAYGSYPEAIADELRTLTETLHPVFVRESV